jgi:L-asparaginase II
VSAAGKAVASVGDPRAFAFIRSSAKPFQLAPFVASGRFDAYDFPAPTEALAIMAASH